jgi:flagellar export protein FliJ
MKRFRFTLQALLEKRAREEDAVKLELARKNSEIGNAEQKLFGLKTELQAMQQEQRDTREHARDIQNLRMSVAYRNQLKLDMLDTGKTIYRLETERGHIRQRLIRATQRKKAIELIRDNRHQEWVKENKLREQVFIDDISQQSFIRKTKRGRPVQAE